VWSIATLIAPVKAIDGRPSLAMVSRSTPAFQAGVCFSCGVPTGSVDMVRVHDQSPAPMARRQSFKIARARAKILKNIATVSLPVLVFCSEG